MLKCERRTISRLLVATVLLAVPSMAQAQSPELSPGRWEGRAETPPGLLPMAVEFRAGEGGWLGRFLVPAEGVRILVEEVAVSEGSVFFQLTPTRSFSGRISGDRLVGTLNMNDRAMPVAFARPGSQAAEELKREVENEIERREVQPLEPAGPVGPERAMIRDEALEDLLQAAEAAHSHSLVLLRDGQTVGVWHSGGEARRIEAMSVTKSILSLAVGRLLTTGALRSIHVPVEEFFPQWRDGAGARVTIRHLLWHTSGLAPASTTEAIYDSEDFVEFALESPLVSQPGEEFAYNNNAANLLAGVVGRAAGVPLDEFVAEELFAPLGIEDFGWARDASGNPHGMSGLSITAEDLAKIGQLVLQRGAWEGNQLIDEYWFDTMLRPSPLNPDVGMLWWLIREEGTVVGFKAEGYLGQYLVVYPEEGLVAVRMVQGSPAYQPATDGFRSFPEMVGRLVR